MSKMGDMIIGLQEAIAKEDLSFEQIAEKFNVPLVWVIDAAKMIDDYEDDYMDGDAASALSSAGFGTDEDYGGVNDSWYEDQYDNGDF